MRKTFVLVLSISLLSAGAPAVMAQSHGTGGVQGIAKDTAQKPLPGVRVQVRASGGQLAASGTTNAQGSFSFAGLNPGSYTVEIFDAAGNLVGTSGSLAVTAGSTATITVFAAAAGAIAAGGGLSLFGLGTLGTVAVVGGAAAVTTAAIVATRDGKIVICHKPAGQPAQTIEVSESAREMHMGHGDVVGACPASPSR